MENASWRRIGLQRGRSLATSPALVVPKGHAQGSRAHRIQNGRRKMDKPMDLPEATEIALVAVGAEIDEPACNDDDLDEEELLRLDETIDRSDAQIARGETVPFDVVLGDVRRILHRA